MIELFILMSHLIAFNVLIVLVSRAERSPLSCLGRGSGKIRHPPAPVTHGEKRPNGTSTPSRIPQALSKVHSPELNE